MQSRRVWLHFCGVERSVEEQIRRRLSQCGLEFQDPDWGRVEGNGVLCFHRVDDKVLERLETLRGVTQFIALSSCSGAMPAELSWQLLQLGASDVLCWDEVDAAPQISARVERWSTVDELVRESLEEGYLAGESRGFRALLRNLVEAARFTPTPILLTGESGTGKELLARLVHTVGRHGDRKVENPVTVDCSTIVPELSGSELFGHERGAFTGAHALREGAFALANRSTLFLDEIGELALPLQTQLLRAIQEKTYKRVGGNVWYPTEFRLVCATNRDLPELVKAGHFRLDLYHRIAGWVFQTLPLRRRRGDVIPLARQFLKAAFDGEAPPIDPAVKEYLISREYPGNVRELRQLVQRIAHRHVGPGAITVGDIPEEDRPAVGQMRSVWPDEQLDRSITDAVALGASLKEINQVTSEMAIRVAVKSERGNLQRAAKRLGVTDRALQMRRAAGRI